MDQGANPNLDLINEANTLNKSNANAKVHDSQRLPDFSGSSYALNHQESPVLSFSNANSSSSSSDVYSEADDDIVGEDDEDESEEDENYVDSDEEQRRLNYNKRTAKMASIRQSGAINSDSSLTSQTVVAKRGRKPKIPGEPPRPRGPPRGPRGPYKPRRAKDPSVASQAPSRPFAYMPPRAYQSTSNLSYEYPYRHPALNGLPPQAILVPMPGPNGIPIMVPYLPASMVMPQASLAASRPPTLVENASSFAATEAASNSAPNAAFNQGQVAASTQMLPIPIITTPSGVMVSTTTGQIIPSPPQFRLDNPVPLAPQTLPQAQFDGNPQLPVSGVQQQSQYQQHAPSQIIPQAPQRLIDANFDATGPSLVKDRARRSNIKSVNYSSFDRDNEATEEDREAKIYELESTAAAQTNATKKKFKHENVEAADTIHNESPQSTGASEAKSPPSNSHEDTDDDVDDLEGGDYLPLVEKIVAVSINGSIVSIEDAISHNDANVLITPGAEHEVDGMRLLTANKDLSNVLKQQNMDREPSAKRTLSKSNQVEGLQLFLVKATNRSYWHLEWVTKDLILAEHGGNVRYHRFIGKPANLSLTPPYFDENYLVIDRILDLYIEQKDEDSLDADGDGAGDNNPSEEDHCASTESSDSSKNSIKAPPPLEGRRSFLIKWKNLSYDVTTWEYEDTIRLKDPDRASQLIDSFLSAREPTERKIQTSKMLVDVKSSNTTIPRPQYAPITDAECELLWGSSKRVLRPYQREGVDWLSFCWCQRQPCIIADEMGLGKTIQAAAFLARISSESFGQVPGPFLVISPLSCIPHWERELAGWAPSLSVLTYQGRASDREALFEYEFWYKDEEKNQLNLPGIAKFDVLLASYEMAVLGQAHLRTVPFRIGIFDEAHRLKNRASRIAEILNTFRIEHKILLTGTPLQNSIEELFALLTFIQPWRFSDEAAFLAEYGRMERPEDVAKIQLMLRPLMLRRLKEDVEASIPLREETIIEVALSSVQKRYYRAILERNLTYLAGGGGGAAGLSSLANAMMELRKTCMHPFLIEGAEDALTQGADYHYVLTHVSSKLLLVEKLLRKLREDTTPHRVLIFSQMTRMLDLIETLLEAHSYPWERIDGRVRGDLRQAAIDRFCDQERDAFVFLLCTRAGGVGINLTAADTVIIFDSDWNPQNDIQAMARCHRIGQTRQVKVYRLICTGTYEQEMLERAGRKLGLDRAILQKMAPGKDITPTGTGPTSNGATGSGDVSGVAGISTTGGLSSFSRKEIEHLLRKGAYGAIFNDEEDPGAIGKIPQEDEDIDVILERRTRVITHTDEETSAEMAPEQGSSIFSKASFVPSKSNFGVDVDDPNFWVLWARHVREGDAASGADGSKSRRFADAITSPLEEDQRRFKRQLKRITREGRSYLGCASVVSLSSPQGVELDSETQSTGPGGLSDTKRVCSDAEKILKALLRFGFGRSRLISDSMDGRYTTALIRKITKSLMEDHILKMDLDAVDKTLVSDSTSLLLLIDDEEIAEEDDTDSSCIDAAVDVECRAILDLVGSSTSLFEVLLIRASIMRLLGRVIDQLFLSVPRKGKKTANLRGSAWLDADAGAAFTFLGVSTSSSGLRSKAPSAKALATFSAALASYDWPAGVDEASNDGTLPTWWQVPLHDATFLLTVWINGLGTSFADLFSDRRLFPPNDEEHLDERKLEQRFRTLVAHVGDGIETRILEKIGRKEDSSASKFNQFDIALPPSRPRKTPDGFLFAANEEDEDEEELWEDNHSSKKSDRSEQRASQKRIGKRRGQVVDDDDEFEAEAEVEAEVAAPIRRGATSSRHATPRGASTGGTTANNAKGGNSKNQKKNTTRPTSPRIKLRMTAAPQ
ncbi:hypothetical protein DI09_1p500 [Mitosporidium daphniae]|uniref:Uncharacterized protein n=1 Tax=Mitosporidium daphniae TaxID=1485682 RepID=A0A098VT95_9MICR|nr:uncharacterized protein DI09_1p500 [Mitosporidium daphniae]KGG52200.1 hypothetical protein DI09_1p500 [Mitosporidium daphniae]|eukprot:XP_013238627.1 uncharacterized protein DI09_1p500 [Mitosporidium daphniae]